MITDTLPAVSPTETYSAPTEQNTGPNLIGKGGYIAYISNKSEDKLYQVWLMKVAMNDSGEFSVVEDTQLTKDPGNKSFPAWSPDGKKLLYSAPSGGATLGIDIWMLDLEKSESAVNLSQQQGEDTEGRARCPG